MAVAYYHHKGEAIRIVNEYLLDKRSATSDSSLATIAILAISEVSPVGGYIFNYSSDSLILILTKNPLR